MIPWRLRDLMEVTGENLFFCTCGRELAPDCDMSIVSIVEMFEKHLVTEHSVTREQIEEHYRAYKAAIAQGEGLEPSTS